MCETHVLCVGHQVARELQIGKRAIPLFRYPAPGTQMHFVDRNRLVDPLRCGARFQPRLILPGVSVQIAHHGRCLGRVFCSEAEWIGLFRQQISLGILQLELVDGTVVQSGHEDFPDPRAAAPPHHVAAPVPGIEIANQRDASCVRCPDREMGASTALMIHHMRAKLFP